MALQANCFAYWAGVSPPSDFLGLSSLYSRLQTSITVQASVRLVNQRSFRHSSGRHPLNDSTYAFWFGLAGSLSGSSIPLRRAQTQCLLWVVA